MNKSLALLAGAGMLLAGVGGLQTATYAQATPASGPFADVPTDHWAYDSVDTLQKAGIVIGYPDGTYGGKRAMTRYEFAVAIARLLPLLNHQPDLSNYATKDDLAALRADLENRLASNQAALDALTKLVNEFQGELEALGQDVAAVKRRLDALEARVAAVEEEQRRVVFHGDLNVIGYAESARDKVDGSSPTEYKPFIDENGRLGADGATGQKYLLADSNVYNDFLLSIRGKVSDTATVNVKLDFGNYLNSFDNVFVGGYQYGDIGILDDSNDQGTTTTLWEAYLDAPVSLGPLGGADLQVGRIPLQWTKYTLKEVNPDVYTNLYQTASGNVEGDGAQLGLKVGPGKLTAYAAKFNTTDFTPLFSGSYASSGFASSGNSGFQAIVSGDGVTGYDSIEQGAGARLTFGTPDTAQLGFSAEQFGLEDGGTTFGTTLADADLDYNKNTAGQEYNRTSVYGGDFSGALPFLKQYGLTLNAAFTASSEGYDRINNVGNNYRYDSHEETLGLNLGPVFLNGGYQYVGPYFSAPGFWGQIGSWKNPTNVKGGIVNGHVSITKSLEVKADYENYTTAYGSAQDGLLLASPLQQGDSVHHIQAGVSYGLSSTYGVDLGWDRTEYELANTNGTLAQSGKVYQDYVTLGLGHTFSKNASFKLLYQIVEFSDKGNDKTIDGGTTGFGEGLGGGNVAVGQFSLKF